MYLLPTLLILIHLISKRISVPVNNLSRAARLIQNGVFKLDIPTAGNDEIGLLTSDFINMGSALQVYGRFSNKEIAEKVIQGDIKPGGFPRHATILFTNIHDFNIKIKYFSNVFKNEASDKIVHWLNNYFTLMIDCVERTGGTADKLIEDSLMAHWGTAFSSGSPRKDAFNCIKAALMMRKAVYYLKKERIDAAYPQIKMGCGISSGVVTAGQFGNERRMEYSVIGEHVNISSRIKALTEQLEVDILVSEDTLQLIGDKFITEEIPFTGIKIIEKPVRIFAVINFSGNVKGPRNLTELRELLRG